MMMYSRHQPLLWPLSLSLPLLFAVATKTLNELARVTQLDKALYEAAKEAYQKVRMRQSTPCALYGWVRVSTQLIDSFLRTNVLWLSLFVLRFAGCIIPFLRQRGVVLAFFWQGSVPQRYRYTSYILLTICLQN